MRLAAVALGFAIAEVDHDVREHGGANTGARVKAYLANAGITIPAPWCAAWIQYITDRVALARKEPNPLDAVKLEALVQSYHDWAEGTGRLVPDPQPGDLVCFKFGSSGRWDHIGLVVTAPDPTGWFSTVEGNTSDQSQRDGDAVAFKARHAGGRYPVSFIRWDMPTSLEVFRADVSHMADWVIQ